jgi:hypothetical protein
MVREMVHKLVLVNAVIIGDYCFLERDTVLCGRSVPMFF